MDVGESGTTRHALSLEMSLTIVAPVVSSGDPTR